MAVPHPESLLQVWEHSYGEHPIHRALALLDAAWPLVDPASWARAPLGHRDAWLLDLHRTMFGAELATTTRCPHCHERLDVAFRAEDVGLTPPDLGDAAGTFRLTALGYEVDYRLPTSEDLLAATAQGADPEAVAARLLDRCVLSARRRGKPVAAADLPEPLVADLAAGIQARDPGVEIRVALSCKDCGYGWEIDFDPVLHVTAELDDWAQRLLAEVHVLAGAYRWAERDIVAMSPLRRQIYLDMVRG
jgi:hypothetical protein